MIDSIAVEQVCDGHNMPLRGEDRAEAIRRMIASGMLAHQIADRLRMKMDSLQAWARDHGIVGLTNRVPAHWTARYVEEHRDPENWLKFKREGMR